MVLDYLSQHSTWFTDATAPFWQRAWYTDTYRVDVLGEFHFGLMPRRLRITSSGITYIRSTLAVRSDETMPSSLGSAKPVLRWFRIKIFNLVNYSVI